MTLSTEILDLWNKINPDAPFPGAFLENDPSLKAPNIDFLYTHEERGNYYSCKTDLLSLIKIMGYTPYEFQIDAIEKINKHRFICISGFRQSGRSLINRINVMKTALFEKNSNVVIFSNNITYTLDALDHIKMLYRKMPYYIKPGIIKWNKNEIEFDNGSKISIVSVDNNRIGRNIDHLYGDNIEFIKVGTLHKFIKRMTTSIASKKNSKINLVSMDPNYLDFMDDNLYSKCYLQPFEKIIKK